jgi:quinol-cytochrome oxidoreductase complex cytochrome b subunit/mono/diheme cytochrome c family protein
MLVRFHDWLDHRIGHRRFLAIMLLEEIPGGAKWRYVWGSTLLFVFILQLITGVLLMTAYSPGDSTAWGSVYFIQYQMDFGWFIRGLHHFGSQMMVVLLGVHMLQVVIAGAQLPPREVNWWLGLGLLLCVLGLSLTGYLLPWDQKGFWATQVATNIAGNVPLLGPFLQRLAVGGPVYGNHTLTRFFTMHVAILPPLVIVLTILHLVAFRRHGVTAYAGAEGEGTGLFWPDQAFRDLLVCLVIFGVMLFLVLNGTGQPLPAQAQPTAEESGWYERWAHAGRQGLGANLDAPADPERQYPARPEWYFLFLFQLLKYFPGDQEVVGTVVIPTAVGILLAVLPLLGVGRLRPFGRIVGVLVVVGLLTGIVSLTFLALADDTADAADRALLTRLAQWIVPALAAFFVLYLAVLGLLRRGTGVRRVVYGFGVVVLALGLLGAGTLAYAAIHHREVPQMALRLLEVPEGGPPHEEAVGFREKLEEADRNAQRALLLAERGIPPAGAVELLRHDPRRLFLKHCAACHSFGEFGPADFKTTEAALFKQAKFKASDLAGWGGEEWIYHFLLDPNGERFLGRSKDKGEPRFSRMAEWVAARRKQYKGKEAELEADFRKIAAWLATSPRAAPPEKSPHAKAYALFTKTFNCVRCHQFANYKGQKNVPRLTGYGSAEWLNLFLRAPGLPHSYGENNAMPAFRPLEGASGELTKREYACLLKQKVEDIVFADLSDREREILVRYLTQEQRPASDRR